MDVKQVQAFLSKWLAAVAVFAKFTPNTVDDQVVAALQVVVANDAVMAILVDLLSYIHINPSATADDLENHAKHLVSKFAKV